MRFHARRFMLAGLAGLALGTAACVLPDQITQVQNDVADLERQIAQIRSEQQAAQREMQELLARAQEEQRRPDRSDAVSREDLADMQVRLGRLERDVSTTEENLSDFNRRLDRFAVDAQTRGGGPPAGTDPSGGADGGTALVPAPGPGSAVPDPEALYNTAYLDYSKGNFDLAIAGFEEYQQRFPESPLADNALYWIGECHFSKGDYTSAVGAFDRLLTDYAQSDRAPASDLKKALAFQEQNLIGQAIVQLRYVVSEYPDSDEARIARDKLSALGQSPS